MVSHEILEHSAQLQDALARNPQLGNEASEKASLRIRALNGKDRVQSIATLQTARQLNLERRAARLERRLLTVNPDSRKGKRLQYALDVANYRAKKIDRARNKVFNRMHERSRGYGDEVDKVAAIEKKRNEFIVRRKIAIEEKRRKKIVKQHERETRQANAGKRQRTREELYNDQHRRERLAEEIKSWDKDENMLANIKARLMAEVNAKYDTKMKTKEL